MSNGEGALILANNSSSNANAASASAHAESIRSNCSSRCDSPPHIRVSQLPSQADSLNELGCGEVEELAPITFERSGGQSPTSYSSERSTPAYLRWAKDLENILNDYEGTT